jgi:hypothetical protein
MKNLFFIFCLFAAFTLSGQSSYRVSEIKAGNFVLHSGKLYFEKEYQNPISMELLEKNLKSHNDVAGGMQVKSVRSNGMNGVMIRYQLDWTSAGFKKRKIATFLRLPVNSNFEVTREGNTYRVRITDLWFNNTVAPGSQQHLSIESMMVTKQGLSITRKKKPLRALSILDENFEQLFRGKPDTF